MSLDPFVLAERIDKHSRPDHRGCLIWQGAKNSRGYSCIGVGGKSQSGHRVAYELYYGPIPAGLQIDHGCYVRACVNPLHLEAVTAKVNTQRAVPRKLGQARVAGVHATCRKGHAIEGENLYVDAKGRRVCLACKNENSRLSQNRVRAQAPRFDGSEWVAIRKHLGWRQQDVADFLGIRSSGQVIVSEWERGRAAAPAHHLAALRSLVERAA